MVSHPKNVIFYVTRGSSFVRVWVWTSVCNSSVASRVAWYLLTFQSVCVQNISSRSRCRRDIARSLRRPKFYFIALFFISNAFSLQFFRFRHISMNPDASIRSSLYLNPFLSVPNPFHRCQSVDKFADNWSDNFQALILQSFQTHTANFPFLKRILFTFSMRIQQSHERHPLRRTHLTQFLYAIAKQQADSMNSN